MSLTIRFLYWKRHFSFTDLAGAILLDCSRLSQEVPMKRCKRDREPFFPVANQFELEYVVIEFTRDVVLPRFAMAKGERYAFVLTRAMYPLLQAICLGGYFEFAGGECDADDVEIIHVGRGDIDWSWLRGHV